MEILKRIKIGKKYVMCFVILIIPYSLISQENYGGIKIILNNLDSAKIFDNQIVIICKLKKFTKKILLINYIKKGAYIELPVGTYTIKIKSKTCSTIFF